MAASLLPQKTLITYTYYEDDKSINRDNLEFFLKHGLHGKADFVLIFNGETEAWKLVPDLPNVKIVRRDNTCYDMGAHAEVLQRDSLWRKYQRFIMMNGSIRGPFLPSWAEACWSERFLSKITDETKVIPRTQCGCLSTNVEKLVGMSFNCWPTPHIASMIWGTDSIGLDLLLHPPPDSPSHNDFLAVFNEHYPNMTQLHGPDYVDQGINKCFADRAEAVEAEISAAGIIRHSGYMATSLLTKFQIDTDFLTHCNEHPGTTDPQGNGYYDGMNYHPYETMFIKTNRGIDPNMIAKLTEWTDLANASSWDYC